MELIIAMLIVYHIYEANGNKAKARMYLVWFYIAIALNIVLEIYKHLS